MEITLLLQYLSYFSAFIPVATAFTYWYKKRFNFDRKANLIGIYLILYFIFQLFVLVLAFNSINNLIVYRIFAPFEVFIFTYFILSLQIDSEKINVFFSLCLSMIIISIDFIWGDQNALPVESLMVQGITITILGMSAIPSIKIRKDYESSFFHFTFAILFASVNTLLGVGFIDIAPLLSYSIQAVVTITSHLIFAWGFYVIIKSES